MSIYDKKYFIKHNRYLYKLFDDLTPNEISYRLKIDVALLNRLYNDELKSEIVSHANAQRICDYIGIPLSEAWEEIDFISKVVPDRPLVDTTDEIIKGLEENIVNRLKVVNLSTTFIKEILEVVDRIVVESVKFGLELKSKDELDKFYAKSNKGETK